VELEDGSRVPAEVPGELALHEKDACIVDVDGVAEFAHVVSFHSPAVGGRSHPRVVRCATLHDRACASENAQHLRMAAGMCADLVRQSKLRLRVVRIRYSFERKVLIVRFSAEENLDVRDLANRLGQQLATRVDMRQIGVRDEAAALGGLGLCGRVQCCCAWLRKFDAVNVRMAKTQGLSLNPGIIGGNCGRLKCCLRYELPHYQELSQRVPRPGSSVLTPDGAGRVFAVDLLRQRVQVRLDDDRLVGYDAGDVRPAFGRRGRAGGGRDEDPGVERTEPEPVGDSGADDLRDDDAR
jgi:cell fate regulator YaaT (PSP1 superfamily)